MTGKSWELCYRDPIHTTYVDEVMSDATDEATYVVRYLVMRGNHALTAYVGIPLDYPCAGWPYDLVPLDVHGGLTFSSPGDGQPWPRDWWWYGWDYGHPFDATFLDRDLSKAGINVGKPPVKVRKWDVQTVHSHAKRAARQMLSMAMLGWRLDAKDVERYNAEQEAIAELLRGGPMESIARMNREMAKFDRLQELGD